MGLRVALWLALVPMLSQADDAVTLHVQGGDRQAMRRALVELAQRRLESDGLVLDPEHAWLNSSSALPASGDIEARPTWSLNAGIPSLPLTFELRPLNHAQAPVVATLAVSLQRRVPVAVRRLRKGSQVSCADLAMELRVIDNLRHGSLPVPCNEGLGTLLRDVARGEVVRGEDIGRLPDVLMGAPVQVSASNGGITVMTLATALADARVGDALDVRLQRPVRTLRARVTARGAAQLLDETP